MSSEFIAEGASVASKGWLPTAFLLLKVFFWAFFIILILAGSVYRAYELHNPSYIAYDLGNRFLLLSSNLDKSSLIIINDNPLTNDISFWQKFIIFSDFVSNFLIIFLWLKVFVYIIRFFRKQASEFSNWFIAVSIFVIFQIFASLINAGLNNQITSVVGGETSALYYMVIPFVSLYHFLQAMIILAEPLINRFYKSTI